MKDRIYLFNGGMVTLVVLGYLMTACEHDGIFIAEDDFNPVDTMSNPIDTGMPCDPGTIYFEQQILPILRGNCALSGCHNANTAQDGIVLEDFESLMNSDIVDAFDVNGSDLYEVLSEDDLDKRMPPPPAGALTSEQISLIAEWIEQGATFESCDPNVSECQTDNVSFTDDITPIINTNCRSCHSGPTPPLGIRLDIYEGIASVAHTGQLIGAIKHLPGFEPMPQGGDQLGDCEINKIEAWVNAGALNN